MILDKTLKLCPAFGPLCSWFRSSQITADTFPFLTSNPIGPSACRGRDTHYWTPPHRSRRAQFTHRDPTLDVWRQSVLLATMEERAALEATHQQLVSLVPIASVLSGFVFEACVAKGRLRRSEKRLGSDPLSGRHDKQKHLSPLAATSATAGMTADVRKPQKIEAL